VAAAVREGVLEGRVVELQPKQDRDTLVKMVASVLDERPNLDIELCDTEDGTPYVSVQLEGWGNIMVVAERAMPGRYGVVVTDAEGYRVKVAKGVPAYSALFQILNHG